MRERGKKGVSKCGVWLCLALGLLALPACGGAASQAKSLGPADVVIDIFSGRPNPSWTMAAADTDRLAALIAALPAGEPVTLPTPLGYRGFGVWWGKPETESRVSVVAYNGVVIEYVGDQTLYYQDPGRTVERFLADRARLYLDPQTAQIVLQAVGQ